MLYFREATYVLAIIDCGSFSSAAKTLFISQPSLSQYIKNLEVFLGFPIFDRSGSKLTLTYNGSKYVEFARALLGLRDGFIKTMEDVSGLHQGHLSIGVSFGRSKYFIPKLIPGFKGRYSGVSIDLYEKPAAALEDALLQGIIDLAITTLPIISKELKYHHFFDEMILIAIPCEHSLTKELVFEPGRKYPLIDLSIASNCQFIMMPLNYRLRSLADQICADEGFNPQVVLTTSNFGTAHSLVSKGLGLLIGPETLLLSENLQPSPVYATFKKRDYLWPIVIAYKPSRYVSPAMEAFIEMSKLTMTEI